MEEDKGRCTRCGFLGKKDIDGYGQECYIASLRNREEGNFSHHIILSRLQLDTIAWCYVDKADFLAEISKMDTSKPQQERILKAITENRQCSSWYSWKEFMWPKEHLEELKMLQLEQRREEFEQRMERERKEFELRLEERNRGEQRRTNTIMIWLTIAAVVFAALQVYAALASINPDHWLFRWLR